jgi:hypothetical protein
LSTCAPERNCYARSWLRCRSRDATARTDKSSRPSSQTLRAGLP